jgi:hypothetical protein
MSSAVRRASTGEGRRRRRLGAGILALLTFSTLGILACGSSSSNDDIHGNCLPPAPDTIPLTCNISCSCGSGGKCEHGQCVSCNCDSDQYCNDQGTCVDDGHPVLWYSGGIGSRDHSRSSPPPA